MSNRYRRAKKFKLDEDNQVTDSFSGSSKNIIKRDWDWCDYHGNKQRLWDLKVRSFRGFIRGQVGNNWDTVYSNVCFRLNNLPDYQKYFFSENSWGSYYPREVYELDGVLYDKKMGRYHGPLSNDELYIDPVTHILCVTPVVKKIRYSYTGNRIKRSITEIIINDKVSFDLHDNSYQRKISCGVFEEVVEKFWVKITKYKKPKINYIGQYYTDDKGLRQHRYDQETVLVDAVKTNTASKLDIKKHNLTKV